MGINMQQLGMAANKLKTLIVDSIANIEHNSILNRDKEDAHPIQAITGLQEVKNKVDKINLYEQYLNTDLDCAFLKLLNSYTPILNQTIPFVKISGNMNVDGGIIKLKPYKTYEFIITLSYADANKAVAGNIQYNLEINGITKHIFSPYRGTLNYEMSSTLVFQYYNDSNIEVDCRLYPSVIYQIDIITHTVTSFSIKEIGKSIIIDPVEHVNTNNGIEDIPVGAILEHMGTKAPKHYLVADGSIYNITEYPYLAQHIKDDFEIINFFGGDGITTFAVPDLRGEFIRGTGTNSITGTKGGNVGVHQEGTNHVHAYSYGNGSNQYLQYRNKDHNEAIYPDYVDKYTKPGATNWRNYSRSGNGVDAGSYGAYKARPDNTAVLLCIKYEPTYFMNINIPETIKNLTEQNDLLKQEIQQLSEILDTINRTVI